MAQSTILAAGTTEATSTDVVVAAGSVVTIGVFVAAGSLPESTSVEVFLDTPGADVFEAELSNERPAVQIAGPCTVRAIRRATGANVGIFSET